jgi:hypothetical protein
VHSINRWGAKLIILGFKNHKTKVMFGDYFKFINDNKLNIAALKGISTTGVPYLEQFVKVEERRDNQSQRRRNVNNSKNFDLTGLD